MSERQRDATDPGPAGPPVDALPPPYDSHHAVDYVFTRPLDPVQATYPVRVWGKGRRRKTAIPYAEPR